MSEIIKGRKLGFKLEDVQEVYEGPVGVLWEMLMGEEIHVGGPVETDILAEKANITKKTHVLDICSALGGPARHLARKFGCRVSGLDATKKMFEEAKKRTEQEDLTHLVSYELGNSLDMPFETGIFDVVWGQDAWCYVTDKKKLIAEASRVIKSGGTIAFTDWIQTDTMSEKEWEALNEFMVFPYMETLDGYEKLLEETGFEVIEKEDLSEDFARHCHLYQDKLRNELKPSIIEHYSNELFEAADSGLGMWVAAADQGKVGRGRWIAKKKK
ncbi:MAG: methyltransferase domain-containing protein [Methanomassiliicoccales archaeon]|nr:MAG: methyltransferase domain-containing protein [Methanomassiliicoccales archaeon]